MRLLQRSHSGSGNPLERPQHAEGAQFLTFRRRGKIEGLGYQAQAGKVLRERFGPHLEIGRDAWALELVNDR